MAFSYLSIGQRIRELRCSKRLSQADLSEMINKSPTYISYIECGIKCMSLETLVDIANALDVTADFLLSDCFANHLAASNTEINKLLSDCSLYESRIIIENVRGLKSVLRENRFSMFISDK